MVSPPSKSTREDTAPFHVNLFYRTGAFPEPGEFGSQPLPSHVQIYTWSDCTLKELALELAAARPSLLPPPAVGTRLVFQLVFPDLRNSSSIGDSQPRFAVKDLGSIVIGENEMGPEGSNDLDAGGHEAEKGGSRGNKTLSDARFVVGDYISCAVLPPLSDGSVAPASSIRRELPPEPLKIGRSPYRGGYQGRDRENGFGRGSFRGRGSWREGGGPGFPLGDWRRGERLPDGPPGKPRGRGRR